MTEAEFIEAVAALVRIFGDSWRPYTVAFVAYALRTRFEGWASIEKTRALLDICKAAGGDPLAVASVLNLRPTAVIPADRFPL